MRASTKLPTYNPATEYFLQDMTNRDFGMFIVAGGVGTGKTTVLKRYLQSFPKNVRMALISESPMEYSSLITTATLEVHDGSGDYETLLPTINSALKTRPSVVVYDGIPTPNVLAKLCMASTTCNVAMILYGNSFQQVFNVINDYGDLADGEINPIGYWNNLKGVMINQFDHSEGNYKHFSQCLKMTNGLMKFLRERADANMLPETTDEAFNCLAENGGHLPIEKQIEKEKQLNSALPLTTCLAYERVLSAGNSLILVGGEKGSGRTTLSKQLAEHYQKVNGPVKDKFIILDEVTTSEQAILALSLSQNAHVVAVIEADSHATIIKRYAQLLEGTTAVSDSTWENIAATLRFVSFIEQFGFSEKRTNRPFLLNREGVLEISNLVKCLPETVTKGLVHDMVYKQGF